MYALSWQTVSVLTRVLFWFLFPSLLRNSGNKQKNNPLVSAKTVCHSRLPIDAIIFVLIHYAEPPLNLRFLPMGKQGFNQLDKTLFFALSHELSPCFAINDKTTKISIVMCIELMCSKYTYGWFYEYDNYQGTTRSTAINLMRDLFRGDRWWNQEISNVLEVSE